MTTVPAPDDRRIRLADNTVGTEEIEAVTEVLRSGWLTAGPVTRDFEQQFAEALRTPNAVAVSSGTAALHLAVLALGIGLGDEVIVPALTFVASAAVVALHGGVPVFADVLSSAEPTLAPQEVARLIGDRTRAIVVPHYAGYPAEIDKIVAIAHAHDLPVIEDAAHAPVVQVDEKRALGTIGDFGCFSFYASKNMTTGEGGMVVARDGDLLERVRATRSHCLTRSTWDRMRTGASAYDVPAIGLNYRPTEISSAIGRVQLAKLPGDRTYRRGLVTHYTELLYRVPGVTVPFAEYSGDAAYHLMAVVLPPDVVRDDVQTTLKAAGVQTAIHYPPTHLMSRYRAVAAYRDAPPTPKLPVTEALSTRLLTLPLHSRMTIDDATYVVERFAEAIAR